MKHFSLRQWSPHLLRAAPVGIAAVACAVLLLVMGQGGANAQDQGLCLNAQNGGINPSCNSQDTDTFTATVPTQSCITGERITITVRVGVRPNASTRYNYGFYFNIEGGSAQTGSGSSCWRDWLSPVKDNPTPFDLTNGYGPFLRNGDNNVCGDAPSGIVTQKLITVPNLLCADNALQDGIADFDACANWDNNADTCNSITDALKAGTNPKCVCQNLKIGGLTARPGLRVAKDYIDAPAGNATFTYTLSQPGGDPVVSKVFTLTGGTKWSSDAAPQTNLTGGRQLTITESLGELPAGTNFVSVECRNDDGVPVFGPLQPVSGSATFTPTNGVIYYCLFKNQSTAIELASFAANRTADGIALAWETGLEVDNAGFNVYRSSDFLGARVKLNHSLIPATGNGIGANYSFLDKGGSSVYYYWLEDVDTSGVVALHGPVRTGADGFSTGAERQPLFLPIIIQQP